MQRTEGIKIKHVRTVVQFAVQAHRAAGAGDGIDIGRRETTAEVHNRAVDRDAALVGPIAVQVKVSASRGDRPLGRIRPVKYRAKVRADSQTGAATHHQVAVVDEIV